MQYPQSRIAVYSSKPSSELNEDQKKSVASLPSIQGAVRELEETRKAIEACIFALFLSQIRPEQPCRAFHAQTMEAEEAKERARQQEGEEKAINDRIANAISNVSVSPYILLGLQYIHIKFLLRLHMNSGCMRFCHCFASQLCSWLQIQLRLL